MKLISIGELNKLISDGDTLLIPGLTFGIPEELLMELEKSFLSIGHPRNLTVIAPGGPGYSRRRGIEHLSHEGLVTKYSGSFLGLSKYLSELINHSNCEGYIWPLGIYSKMLREIIAGRPGVFSHIGLRSFVDPRIEGGRLNAISNDSQFIPEFVQFLGRETLFYKPFHINVALLRGTTADEAGNITLEKEAGLLDVLLMAMATKKCGGKVIIQVERYVQSGSLKPQQIKVPGIFVDAIVLANIKNHKQTLRTMYDPYRSGEIRKPEVLLDRLTMGDPVESVIGKRCFLEISEKDKIGIGGGFPETLFKACKRLQNEHLFHFFIEAGIINGDLQSGIEFNTMVNPEIVLDQNYVMDFFDGGGCDVCFLGFAQIDQLGNINVTKMQNRMTGLGGFLDLAQSSKKRIHCGTFTAGKQEINIQNGKLSILQGGAIKKFVQKVEQISMSSLYSKEVNQPVVIITERAVFEVQHCQLILKEIAPGIDLYSDILNHMDFQPIIPQDLKEMDSWVFS